MLNKVILIGRMTRDPDQRGKDPEKPIASFRIAVDRDYKRDGEPEADFFDCSVFGQQAKFVLQYGRKGRLLCVVGAIQRRTGGVGAGRPAAGARRCGAVPDAGFLRRTGKLRMGAGRRPSRQPAVLNGRRDMEKQK